MQSFETQSSALPPLIECVPNFSEGRDAAKLEAIIQAILDGPEILLLDSTMDVDHNRSVVTFAGSEEVVGHAALRGIGRAVDLIDLSVHRGVHPRIGAADVVPLVPLCGARMEACIRIARWIAEEAARRFNLPSYLYEAAACRPDRRNLETVRRGQFEELRNKIQSDPERIPDFGERRLHPTAGALAVGARDLLVAFNVNLATSDVSRAKSIARSIRASNGGLACVKSLGFYLPSRNLAQVSINLTDFRTTPLGNVFEAVREEARRLDVNVLESEIIGLIPAAAIDETLAAEMRVRNFDRDLILESRLEKAVMRDGRR
jgi:glutamate formiminotransferase / formiminotetrahydrofolate cyclodeaminase